MFCSVIVAISLSVIARTSPFTKIFVATLNTSSNPPFTFTINLPSGCLLMVAILFRSESNGTSLTRLYFSSTSFLFIPCCKAISIMAVSVGSPLFSAVPSGSIFRCASVHRRPAIRSVLSDSCSLSNAS